MSISSTRAGLVWLIAALFYAYQYVLRVMPSIMMNDIMQQFSIDAALFGQFSGVYYLGYAVMHIPLGILLDRLGPRIVMTVCILLTAIGSLPLLVAQHWAYPIIGRALIGMGSSAAILGTFAIIRMCFKPEHFSRMLSFAVMIGLVGAIYGGGPVRYLCETMGYQSVLSLSILAGFALAIITYAIIPTMTVVSDRSVKADIKAVLSNRAVIILCFCAGLMVGPLEGFADVWGSAFLTMVYGLEAKIAASLPSLIFIGMCFGAPVLSFIAEKTGRYSATIIGAGLVMAIAFTTLLTGTLTLPVITVLFAVIGVCSAYQILAIYQASTYVVPEVAGLTTAVANMIIMSLGYAFHSAIGGIIKALGGTQVKEAYFYGIGIIPVTLAVGVLGFILLACSKRKAA